MEWKDGKIKRNTDFNSTSRILDCLKGKEAKPKVKFDFLTSAGELPVRAALALARDIIRAERYLKEQQMLEEIRQKRKDYQALKKRIVSENYSRFSWNHSTSRSGFSYFVPLEKNREKSNEESCYAKSRNEEAFIVNKTIAADKMRKFGEKYKTLRPVKEKSQQNVKTKPGLFYP